MSLMEMDKCYVCLHVFGGRRLAKLVVRDEGDWVVTCGGDHLNSSADYRLVHLDHLIKEDETLAELTDLGEGWEAERSGLGKGWVRRKIAG